MGLRFRKSIKICKGVRINFGKTGASVSFGQKGFHKTFHTSGRQTTSIGLPGTGLYWTETTTARTRTQREIEESNSDDFDRNQGFSENEAGNYNNPMTNRGFNSISQAHSSQDTYPGLNSDWDDFDQECTEIIYPKDELISTDFNQTVDESNSCLNEEDIKRIYRNSDCIIDWIEISDSLNINRLGMDNDLWNYCLKKSESILNGDIDTYLQVIEDLRPLDDLLMFVGDFEFGTEKSNTMEVEYTAKTEGVLVHGNQDSLFEELINAVAIRVARDLMALLPINTVKIYITTTDESLIKSVTFTKRYLRSVNYYVKTATEIVNAA